MRDLVPSLMSIEYDILRQIDFTKLIKDFAKAKSHKVPGLQSLLLHVYTSGVNASSRSGGRTTEWGGVWEGNPHPTPFGGSVGSVWGGGSAPPPKLFGFMISKWHILVKSEMLNIKFS